jgi:hypothetical protein
LGPEKSKNFINWTYIYGKRSEGILGIPSEEDGPIVDREVYAPEE